jgi:hypothetical protein
MIIPGQFGFNCPSGASTIKNPTKRIGLVQSGHLHHLIECYLFSPGYTVQSETYHVPYHTITTATGVLDTYVQQYMQGS